MELGCRMLLLQMYNEVYNTLKRGRAVGIFPEGGSHDRTSLLPFKSGCAVFALGCANAPANVISYLHNKSCFMQGLGGITEYNIPFRGGENLGILTLGKICPKFRDSIFTRVLILGTDFPRFFLKTIV